MADEQTEQTSDLPWLKSYPYNVKWDQKFSSAPLYKLLDESAAKFPHRPLMNFLGRKYSYRDVNDLVNRAACGLQNLGVKKGTNVGLYLPNTPSYLIFYYAILKAGGTVVNFSPLYAERELLMQIEDSEVEIMVTLDLEALFPKIQPMLKKTALKYIIVCPLKEQLTSLKGVLFSLFKSKELAKVNYNSKVISFHDVTDNAGSYQLQPIDPAQDTAVIQYTGGTTGLPKGAMLTHANLYINTHQALKWYPMAEDGKEKLLAALPLFHVFAMTAVMNLAIRLGGEIIMMFPRFNVDDALRLVEKHKITFFPGVPSIYNYIANHPKAKKYNLSSIKACLSGGAPLPHAVKNRFESLTGCSLVEAYGLSETSPAVSCNPLEGINKEGSIGIPFPATKIKIMSLDDPFKEMPLGEKGEICILGPQVMKGYWKRPAESGSTIVSELFHTGDVGYMDKDGYTFLIDRIKDLILCSGYNVYPRAIEEAIYLHPHVEEVTVIAVPDPQRGEIPKAFIKLKDDKKLSAEELIEYLKDKISPIEMPREVEFREMLPKTMIGKLSKKELIAEEMRKRFPSKPGEN